MTTSRANNTDKLKIIDDSTYTQIRERSSGVLSRDSNHRIRNAKYRKKHQNENGFNLSELIAATKAKKTKNPNAHYRKACSLSQAAGRTSSKKSREEQKKKLSRIKNSVLKGRRQRQERLSNVPEEDQSADAGNQTVEVPIQEPLPKPSKTIHSRKFREYCDNCTTPELAQLCKELLSDLDRFQKRAYEKNPIKANAHRRFVVGFRQVKTNLKINKIKLVIMATDCEKCDVDGGLDDAIESIKTNCKALEVPYAFPMQRRQLAFALKRRGNISCIGIVDYDGAREKFSQLVSLLQIARDKYSALKD